MRSYHGAYLLSCLALPLYAGLVSKEAEFAKKVHSSFLIKDSEGARECVEAGLSIFPTSSYLRALHIQALAEAGDRKRALAVFKDFAKGKELPELFSLLESLSWSYLLCDEEKSERTRLIHLIGASLTKDARAVEILHKALLSSNSLLRGFAVRFATSYNDKSLQKEIVKLAREEKDWFVRGEMIQALGAMRVKEAIPFLKEVVASRATAQEEKAMSIQALLQIYDRIVERDLDLLLTHKRAGLRRLGVAFIDHFGAKENLSKAIKLLQDPSPEVRMSVIALLSTTPLDLPFKKELEKELPKLVEDLHPGVATLSGFLALSIDQEMGKTVLRKFVLGKERRDACFAASVAGAGGKSMKSFLQGLMQEVQDPFVKANLALALIRNSPKEAQIEVDFLAQFIAEEKGELMWAQHLYPMFTCLVPSRVRHMPHSPSYPKEIDQLTRLRLLNILCIADAEKAGELIRAFLHNRTWGVVGAASTLALQEGDLEAIEIVRGLLNDPDEEMRIQAALALAFHGGDQAVSSVLESAYPKVNWEKKINILEALGFIGNRSSIPFLLSVLEEPFQLSRTVAAASIIQCLYK
jgi:HEAT repeat protein